MHEPRDSFRHIPEPPKSKIMRDEWYQVTDDEGRSHNYLSSSFAGAIFAFRTSHGIHTRMHQNDNGDIKVTRLSDYTWERYRLNS